MPRDPRSPAWEDVPGGEVAPRTPPQNLLDAPLLQPYADDIDIEQEYSPTSPAASDAGEHKDVEMEELVGLLAREEQEEVPKSNSEILPIISELDGNARRYARERRAAVNRIIAGV